MQVLDMLTNEINSQSLEDTQVGVSFGFKKFGVAKKSAWKNFGSKNFVTYQNHVGHHLHLYVGHLGDGGDLLGDGGDHLDDGDELHGHHNDISTLSWLGNNNRMEIKKSVTDQPTNQPTDRGRY